MGLAASQARFLGITARKSNIEYEGQQVNQQRTALAEEVNALYNKLLSVKVPVAPDTTEFYESNYSFAVSNTANYDGDYLVKSYFQNDDGTYFLNTERTYNKNVAVGTKNETKVDTFAATGNAEKPYRYSTENGTFELGLAQNGETIAALINSTYGEGTVTDTSFYCFQDTNNNGITTYIPQSIVESAAGQAGKEYSTYTAGNRAVTESVAFSNAAVTFDSNNRMSKVFIEKDPATGEKINISSDVDTSRVYDSEGYDAALRDYTMSKDEYDKKVADLNAQTESLQQEDKVLEMRLNQIDTEQNELQTELDAVKAVLDKNIEKTFNTFS